MWSIARDDEYKLWVKLFKIRYLSYSHIFLSQYSISDSYVWQGIQKASNKMKHNYCYRVGNGADMRVWSDVLVGDKPLLNYLNPDATNQVDLSLQVKNIITDGA